MSCERFEKAIALHAGGELPRRSLRRLEEHLEVCPGCRSLADELCKNREALGRWQTAAPAESLMAEMRRNVIAAVEREGAQRSFWQNLFASAIPNWRLAAGLAAAGIVAAALWFALPHPPAETGGKVVRSEAAEARQTPLAAVPSGNVLIPDERREERLISSDAGKTGSAGIRSAVRTARLTRRKARPGVAGNESDAAPALRRIEMQTSNPNIRIIWLVQQAPGVARPTGAAGG